MVTFPAGLELDYEDKKKRKLISSMLFGNRFKSDQTMYEYLIEFLLVYSSAKNADLSSGKMQFHRSLDDKKMSYWVEPRMGLRRFIFYDKARKNGALKADEKAYQRMVNILIDKMDGINEENSREYIESIQDLFHGYVVVIKKRFWGAQALLPICPEFIMCGCDPSESKRKLAVNWEDDPETVDSKFSFDRRNFLSRGGEVYYLHLLQGLQNSDEKRKKLEYLLNDLVCVQCKKISKMASFIEDTWESEMGFDKHNLSQQLNLSYIPAEAYQNCEEYSVDELINYLSCKINPINRIDILAKGVMFQIMRMMSWRVSGYLGIEKKKWIVDMRGASSDTVKKVAAESYRSIEDDFMTALNKIAREIEIPEDDLMSEVRKAKKDSLDIFRAKGKELQCIIPISGSFERFSLSEDVIRFLVLALIAPQEKMTLNMFLEKLYTHFGIVIGSDEYRKSLDDDSVMETTLANSFSENVIAFQNFLKATGFLRELSDATPIVINPYSSIEEED